MNLSTARVRLVQRILLYGLLVLMAVIVLFPLYQALVTSLATDTEVSTWPPTLFPSGLHLENYTTAMERAPLLRYVFNSFVQSGTVMIMNLILASLAGYAFAFIDFKFKNFFFLLFLSTMMIPWEAIIIPNYMTVTARNPLPFCSSNEVFAGILQFINNLNIVKLTVDASRPACTFSFRDSYLGLTLPYMATAFGTFLVRQFFMSIPRDLHDAAMIDGCGRLRFLITIAVPLARPALGTLAIFSFLQTYNQYFWPLLITNDESMRTAQIGLALLEDAENMQFNIVQAGVVIVLIPTFILFIIGNRQLIRGLTAGAVKG